MTFRPSTPSSARRKRARFLILLFAVTGSLIRISRRDFHIFPVLAPLDFHGTSTNFAVCAGMPFIAFCFRDVIGISYYVKTALGTAVGLSIYELAQIYLPRRTFDPGDIVASFAGAIASIVLASLLFLTQRKNEKNIEPCAPPNSGPAASVDNSNVSGGPPSVRRSVQSTYEIRSPY